VLHYSKISSFEKAGTQQGKRSTSKSLAFSQLTKIGTISNELYQVTNLALLCEDTVNGVIAAIEFRGAG
jgi:hypothetical protein